MDSGEFATLENMIAAAENLTYEEFQAKYEQRDCTYEYWYGKAIPKGMPTWIHGFLQGLLIELLKEAGYLAGSEVELRIISEAHPRPDVIATKGGMELPYPTSAVDVVVEILSLDDSMSHIIDKCSSYQKWGFSNIYVVDPDQRLVFRWAGRSLEISDALTVIPVETIWTRLDQATKRK